MKNLFLLLLVMSVLQFTPFEFISTKIYAQWEILNEGAKGEFKTIDFVNENVGWIAGDDGTLINTQDGGGNWNAIAINEEWNISMIDFITESIGWAIRDDEDWTFIMKSIDGGDSWSTQKQIETALHAIYVVDENNVYVAGDAGKVFKTTNGGTDWTTLQLNSDYAFSSIWAINSQIVVLVGSFDGEPDQGIILKTIDGGNNWQEIIAPEFNRINDLQFLNDSTCYFLADHYFICESVDTCNSWIVVTGHNNINSYRFISDTIAYLTMDKSIMKSTDGGFNWQNIQSFNLSLGKIYFTEINFGFILSEVGLLTSTEGGNDWIIQKIIYPLNSACFITKDRGFLVGGYSWFYRPYSGTVGYIFPTNDGGSTLTDNSITYGIAKTCLFIDEDVGFVLTRGYEFGYGSFTELFKSTDGGTNWDEVYLTGLSYFLGNDLCYGNDGIIWSVGCVYYQNCDSASVIASTDLGETWNIIKKFPEFEELYSICFTDSIGWSVGEGGNIIKYTPQDGWMLRPQVTNLPLNKVFFSDEDHGWITGGYNNNNNFQHIILRTTDGGENWETDQTTPYVLNDVYFINDSLGWVVGYDEDGEGAILKTDNGGEDWDAVIENLIGKLNSIEVNENYAWAVGEYGLILRTTDNGVVWVDEMNNNIYPTEFCLEQNYPNPFNPSTSIRYSIPQSTNVTIKVFDILGSEIEMLVNKEKAAGTYELTWNAANLPSGIYFYQIQAGSILETKKMILLR